MLIKYHVHLLYIISNSSSCYEVVTAKLMHASHAYA